MTQKKRKQTKKKQEYTPQPKDMPLLDDFKAQLGSWQKLLQSFVQSKKFKEIYQYIKKQYNTKTIYPPPQDVFSAFSLTPLSQLKVVIVGQDPYHQPKQAHGLCFSVKKPVPPPPSLKNIFKNLSNDSAISFKMPNHGQLTNWAKQGVFLLNALLTVQRSNPMAHSKCGWQDFTGFVIKQISDKCQGIVFLLWGLPAQKKGACIDQKKHKILKTSHPSPLSANNGFLDSKCFSQCNKILKQMKKKQIDWNLD